MKECRCSNSKNQALQYKYIDPSTEEVTEEWNEINQLILQKHDKQE